MGKDLTLDQEIALEVLIDECGLAAVLQSLSSVCDQKGEHILSSYADRDLAKAWATAGGVIGLMSISREISRIGEP